MKPTLSMEKKNIYLETINNEEALLEGAFSKLIFLKVILLLIFGSKLQILQPCAFHIQSLHKR